MFTPFRVDFFLQNSASAKFRENTTFAKFSEFIVVKQYTNKCPQSWTCIRTLTLLFLVKVKSLFDGYKLFFKFIT